MAEQQLPIISLYGGGERMSTTSDFRILTEAEAEEAERCFGMWACGYFSARPGDLPSAGERAGSLAGNMPDRKMSLLAGRDEFSPELLRAVELRIIPEDFVPGGVLTPGRKKTSSPSTSGV